EEETHHPSSTPLTSPSSQDEGVLLGDMTGLVYHPNCINEGAPASNVPQQPAQAMEEDKVKEPAHFSSGNLHLVTDSAGEPLLDE
ncbi:hypothetical protein ABTH94_21215, partial [Acinetobacter baumannii]